MWNTRNNENDGEFEPFFVGKTTHAHRVRALTRETEYKKTLGVGIEKLWAHGTISFPTKLKIMR